MTHHNSSSQTRRRLRGLYSIFRCSAAPSLQNVSDSVVKDRRRFLARKTKRLGDSVRTPGIICLALLRTIVWLFRVVVWEFRKEPFVYRILQIQYGCQKPCDPASVPGGISKIKSVVGHESLGDYSMDKGEKQS